MLAALKKQGFSRYGALVSHHNLAFEARWVDGQRAVVRNADDLPLGSPDVSSLADLAVGYELVKALRVVPVTKASIFPLILVALIPMAGVALTQVPFKANLGSVKGLLLV